MSIHIGAEPGAIAPNVLLPGDPLRAKMIAETYLEGAVQYNRVRNMFGYTGTYKGVPVSVQGTGMGMPSISIYVHELLRDYGARRLIRVGTCGALQPELKLRDVVLAVGAATDSQMNRLRFYGIDYAPTADFRLLQAADAAARALGVPVKIGNVFTTDSFYADDDRPLQALIAYGTLAVEMETAALYTLAHKFRAQALSVLTVSDHLVTREETTAEERERTFRQMVEIALEALVAEAAREG
ncbi:purine-nucleoside phosphorylase [Hydrogenibacillus schlegelii]|uniref:Purine nucleoside phosphorylase DeoD-type n=1 Tax=Hydrogenibacillus schlegelii TaxID=1484 RepID=A0A132N8X9_HYDSH|nr:purine-nucleoside phosphorylase [Hydrogenibacillus schlegelii]KWX06579.1 purine nucleoside phosphorylase DeoD-type [Hydrogenibacillus schlegelii]OAR04177.1 purine nucleoside phosphorylase DeoD-type [Hydrogenibacillus schlegelii]